MLDVHLSATLAQVALANVGTEYPYKLDQVLGCDDDVRAPRTLHPVFHGSYDWHSCVHMHWSLARLLRLHPEHSAASATRAHFDQRLTAAGISGELATFAGPYRASFERPYGWGWLLKLAAELHLLAAEHRAAVAWRDAVAPLARMVADRFSEFLPRVRYATRTGGHGNSALALLLALDYCEAIQHRALQRLIIERANAWFGHDRGYPADYEPSGEDFLSSGLIEAALMRRVVDGCSFADWWAQFQPTHSALRAWLRPVTISDASDAKIVHLHGVNLSRAWCWQQLLPELASELKSAVQTTIKAHLAASLPAALPSANESDYVGLHWLASYAVLALTEK